MKKSLCAVALFLFILSSPFVQKTHAQAKPEQWVCLEAVGDWAVDPFKQTLKARTEAEGRPLPSTETYIVECVGTVSKGQICTTGNPETDGVVYNQNNLQLLLDSGEFTFSGMYQADGTTNAPNPLMSDETGEVNGIIWHANSAHLPRKFLAMNYYEPTGTGGAGNVGALQNATFVFDREGAAKNCAAIYWDPYGRVFDSQTLEPVENSRITLLFKKNNAFVPMTSADLVGGNLINPQNTTANGGFSFVVPNGDYKLLVNFPSQITSSLSQVHANYTKAYSELYPYVPADIDGVIQERGVIQHRDIPVATQGTNALVNMLGYFYESDRATGNLTIEGSVTHPLTKIIAKSVKVSAANPSARTSYREIGATTADKMGKFRLEIDQSKLEKTADYVEIFSDIDMIKVDLRAATPTQGSATSKHFEPIPRYLEGYAIINGSPMPNTKVKVVKLMSNKAYSTVQTDEKGYFKLSSEYVPTDPYELRYVTAAGTAVKISTSAFIAANQKTIFENKIDVNSYLNKDNKTMKEITAAANLAKKLSGGSGSSNRRGTDSQPEEPSTQVFGPLTGLYIGIIVTLVFLVVLGVGGAVMLMKKKTPPDPMIQ